jgi:hypothetical protein
MVWSTAAVAVAASVCGRLPQAVAKPGRNARRWFDAVTPAVPPLAITAPHRSHRGRDAREPPPPVYRVVAASFKSEPAHMRPPRLPPSGARAPADGTLVAVRAVWPIRLAWALLAVASGPALGGALDARSRPVQVVAAVALWCGWAAVMAALLVPRASSLTVLRLAAPAPLVTAIVAAIAGPAGADDAVAVAAGVAVAAAAALPATADAFVDGSSYGSERRFALRTPPPLLLGAAPLAWLLSVAVPAAAALLLAAGEWIAGGVAGVASVGGVALGVPAFHRLSRRWLVFVPAGLVVHDHLALADPVLLRRATIVGVAPAPAAALGDGAVDLTLGALGLAVEIVLQTPVEVGQVDGWGRNRRTESVRGDRFVVTPGRPGAVLHEAASRRYAIATAEPTTSFPS